MVEKYDPDATSDEKLLKLYMILLFSKRGLSTAELTDKLNCSNQTIGRLVAKLENIFPQHIKRKKIGRAFRYYFDSNSETKYFLIDFDGLKKLTLLRDLMSSFLPKNDIDTIDKTISATSSSFISKDLLNETQNAIASRFYKGKINYDFVYEQFDTLQNCIRTNKGCKISYEKEINGACKVHNFAPKKIIAYGDAMYILGWVLNDNNNLKFKRNDPSFFAIHRIKSVEVLDIDTTNFDDVLQYVSKTFGLRNKEEFKVKIKFPKFLFTYISDRTWSHDQVVKNYDDDYFILEIYSSSKDEIMSFVLSFGKDAELLEPNSIREEIKEHIIGMSKKYE